MQARNVNSETEEYGADGAAHELFAGAIQVCRPAERASAASPGLSFEHQHPSLTVCMCISFVDGDSACIGALLYTHVNELKSDSVCSLSHQRKPTVAAYDMDTRRARAVQGSSVTMHRYWANVLRTFHRTPNVRLVRRTKSGSIWACTYVRFDSSYTYTCGFGCDVTHHVMCGSVHCTYVRFASSP